MKTPKLKKAVDILFRFIGIVFGWGVLGMLATLLAAILLHFLIGPEKLSAVFDYLYIIIIGSFIAFGVLTKKGRRLGEKLGDFFLYQ